MISSSVAMILILCIVFSLICSDSEHDPDACLRSPEWHEPAVAVILRHHPDRDAAKGRTGVRARWR